MKRKKVVIGVTGGRTNNNRTAIYKRLDRFHAKREIVGMVNGLAAGADSIAKQWAEENGIKVYGFAAKWSDINVPGAVVKQGKYGPYNALAGPMRNQEMVDSGLFSHLIHFDGGTGTFDMIKRCQKAGIKIYPKLKD